MNCLHQPVMGADLCLALMPCMRNHLQHNWPLHEHCSLALETTNFSGSKQSSFVIHEGCSTTHAHSLKTTSCIVPFFHSMRH